MNDKNSSTSNQNKNNEQVSEVSAVKRGGGKLQVVLAIAFGIIIILGMLIFGGSYTKEEVENTQYDSNDIGVFGQNMNDTGVQIAPPNTDINVAEFTSNDNVLDDIIDGLDSVNNKLDEISISTLYIFRTDLLQNYWKGKIQNLDGSTILIDPKSNLQYQMIEADSLQNSATLDRIILDVYEKKISSITLGELSIVSEEAIQNLLNEKNLTIEQISTSSSGVTNILDQTSFNQPEKEPKIDKISTQPQPTLQVPKMEELSIQPKVIKKKDMSNFVIENILIIDEKNYELPEETKIEQEEKGLFGFNFGTDDEKKIETIEAFEIDNMIQNVDVILDKKINQINQYNQMKQQKLNEIWNAKITSPITKIGSTAGGVSSIEENISNINDQEFASFDTLPDVSTLIAKGKVINSILETAINTDIPGMLRAVISRDVYSEYGNNILIPKGSRLVGQYNSSISRGQKRIVITWERVNLLNGFILNLNSPGVDNLGRAGIDGEVDNRYFEILSNTAMFSALGIAIGAIADSVLASPTITSVVDTGTGSNAVNSSIGSNIANTAAGNFASVIQDLSSGSIKYGPTITIQQGTPIKIFVNKDISFPENVIIPRKALFGKNDFVLK